MAVKNSRAPHTASDRHGAAIYCRVSRQEQADRGYSLEAQETDCRKLAAELGTDVVTTYQDVESGAEWELPGLNAILDAAGRGEFDIVICWDPDRLARGMAKQLVVEEELKKHGVSLRYFTLRLGDTAEDRLLKNVRASIAEYEREKIALRTSRGRRAKAERGLIVGTGVAPYGYVYTYTTDSHDRKPRVSGLKPDPRTAPIVQRMFRDLTRMSVNLLCDALNAEGITTHLQDQRPGAIWANSTVLSIVNNPVYLGTAAYGRRDTNKRWRDASQWLIISCPALVDRATWDAAHEALAQRKSRHTALSAEAEAAYPLRGLLVCGRCGGQLACLPNNGYRYYTCLRSQPDRARRQNKPRCDLPPVPADDLDAYLWELVARRLLDPEHLARGLEAARGENDIASRRHQEHLETIDTEIRRLRARLERITDELLDTPRGSEAERALRGKVGEAEQAIARLQGERAQLAAQPEPGLTAADAIALEEFAAEVRAGLEQATPTQQRQVYGLLKLQACIRDDIQGVKLGRRHCFGVDPQAVIELRMELTNGSREMKKTRVRYFTTELDEWEAEYLGKMVSSIRGQ